MIILDTDVAAEILRGNPVTLNCFHDAHDIKGVSAVTAAELFYGAENSSRIAENTELVEKFLEAVSVVPASVPCARVFGRIKAQLKKRRNLIPDADLLIAATALNADAKLATGNTSHFSRIEGLRLENWIRP